MFDFLKDADNYDIRKIGRDEFPWGFISTAAVSDGSKPYETAVKHSKYRDTGMVIVESYDTKEQAQAGHKKWIKTMTSKKLPKSLKDCCNAHITQLLGEEMEYKLSK